MKILTVIGTRPQYIKVAPLCDYFEEHDFVHLLVDTNQHYEQDLSGIFVEEFHLNIDFHLHADTSSDTAFISDVIDKLAELCAIERPSALIVLGDTNTSLASSIVANKLGIKLAHIEAGIRCNDRTRPEEINRILIDELADIHFLSRIQDARHVRNPVFVGDLEYTLLNDLDRRNLITEIDYENWYVMTIHRYENTNPVRLNEIFNRLQIWGSQVMFPLHHRTKKIIEENNISVPKNVNIIGPLGYNVMVDMLCRCRGVITDSGGLVKICPFFGKKCLIPAKVTEWVEVVDLGYGKVGLDMDWFKNYKIARRQTLYLGDNSCEIIVQKLTE